MIHSEDDETIERPEGDLPSDRVSEEEVDLNVMGSFPASDPPSWTLGVRPNKTFHTEFDGDSPGLDIPSYQNEPPE